VVVVVEPLAGGEPGQPLQVAGPVGVRSAPEGVTGGVHRRAEGEVGDGVDEPGHEPQPRAEHEAQQHDAEAEAEHGVVEQHAVPPVGRQVARVPGHHRLVGRRPPVEDHVAQLHVQETEQDGGMGVALLVGVGVVLAVHGHPLAGPDAGGDPCQDPEDDGDAGDRCRALWARARRKVVVTRLASWVR